jgi:hypothetical protein
MLSGRRLVAKIGGLFRRMRAEDELAREVAAHLALLQDDFERRGLTPVEARLAARRAYGSVDRAKEAYRDERSFVWLEQALQDLRHACRSLAKSPAALASIPTFCLPRQATFRPSERHWFAAGIFSRGTAAPNRWWPS